MGWNLQSRTSLHRIPNRGAAMQMVDSTQAFKERTTRAATKLNPDTRGRRKAKSGAADPAKSRATIEGSSAATKKHEKEKREGRNAIRNKARFSVYRLPSFASVAAATKICRGVQAPKHVRMSSHAAQAAVAIAPPQSLLPIPQVLSPLSKHRATSNAQSFLPARSLALSLSLIGPWELQESCSRWLQYTRFSRVSLVFCSFRGAF